MHNLQPLTGSYPRMEFVYDEKSIIETCLGHMIDADGLYPLSGKISAIQSVPAPNLKIFVRDRTELCTDGQGIFALKIIYLP